MANSYHQQANNIALAAHKKFWNEAHQAYVSYAGEQAIENHFAEYTQSLALLCNLPNEPNIADSLRVKLASPDNGLVPTTLSSSIYKYDAILSAGKNRQELVKFVLNQIAEQWGMMLYRGATSFWETIRGANDFAGAGSLCHGWSAVPAYIYQAYILGIKPLEYGFKKFSVNPLFANLPYARGKVPTPSGNIKIAWQKIDDKYVGQLEHPVNLTPVFVDSEFKCDWKISICSYSRFIR